eukprot:m.296390 g.296390  ORF g.296390 m.296390 type:complete len:248 (-) comp55162_c1_seq2:74-817(-)
MAYFSFPGVSVHSQVTSRAAARGRRRILFVAPDSVLFPATWREELISRSIAAVCLFPSYPEIDSLREEPGVSRISEAGASSPIDSNPSTWDEALYAVKLTSGSPKGSASPLGSASPSGSNHSPKLGMHENAYGWKPKAAGSPDHFSRPTKLRAWAMGKDHVPAASSTTSSRGDGNDYALFKQPPPRTYEEIRPHATSPVAGSVVDATAGGVWDAGLYSVRTHEIETRQDLRRPSFATGLKDDDDLMV